VIFRSSATAAVQCFIDKLFAAVVLLRYFSKFFTLRCSCTAAAEFSTKVYYGRIFIQINIQRIFFLT
jgi:hypothetical protein